MDVFRIQGKQLLWAYRAAKRFLPDSSSHLAQYRQPLPDSSTVSKILFFHFFFLRIGLLNALFYLLGVILSYSGS